MDIDKIIQLIDKVAQTPITSLNIEEGSLKISIEKNNGVTVCSGPIPIMQEPIAQTGLPEKVQTVPLDAVQAQTAPFVSAESEKVQNDEEGTLITAPIVGVFYSASSPDAAPFVKVGDTVKKGQVVGIVEAMKLMNEIESEVDGVIAEVLVKNQMAVEYGQPLFRVK